MLQYVCVKETGLNGDAMTFNEILTILRDSEINEKVKFTNDDYLGYFVKENLGAFVYYNQYGKKSSPMTFYLSDFDRDDWEIIK